MDPQNKQQDDSDAYLASFESSNRKRKLLIALAAFIIGAVAVGIFVATIGSLGKMSESVQGAFSGDPNAAPAQGTSPSSTPPQAEPPPATDAAPTETTPQATPAP